MPSRGQSFLVTYVAWDTSANTYKTGDVANHTLRLIKDGVSQAPTNAASEVDATNTPGLYIVALTSAEATFNVVEIAGKSATANIVLIGKAYGLEQLPVPAPAAAGGLLTFGSGVGSLSTNAGGIVDANAKQISGTTAQTSLAANNSNVVNINGTAAVTSLAAGNVNVVLISGALAQTSLASNNSNIVNIQGTGAATSLAAGNVNVVSFNGTSVQTSLALGNVNASLVGVTSTAQFGVNVVTWLGDTPARLLNGTLVQGAVSGSVASVTGSVGSVTARVTANADQINGVATVTSLATGNVNVVSFNGTSVQTSLALGNVNATLVGVTSTAQFGVNVVTWLGDGPARLLNGTLVQSATSGPVASVTGAVGSVTGNVGGNVSGSVASVTARVTANTDQIAGVSAVTSLAGGNVNTVNVAGAAIQQASGFVRVNVTQWQGEAPNVLISGKVDANATLAGITSSAQFGVNVVTWKGDDPARLINGTLVQASVSGAVASVTNRVTANTDQIAGITAPSSLAANNVNVVNVNGTAIQALSGFIQTSTMQWLGIAPNPLVGGKVDASITAATSTAAFGVNVVTWLGDAPARLLNATLVQSAVSGAVASVTGAVGSVGGNVGGNIVGSVASVVGDVGGNLVGNVNGNVNGNVAGSVNSVTTRVTANTDQIAGVSATTSLALGSVNTVSIGGSAIQQTSGFAKVNIVEWLGVTPAPLIGNGLLQAVTSGPLGTVTVGDYAAGQDPATYVLVTPANKISTDASGSVTAGALAPFAIGTGTFQAATFTTPLFAANYLTSALVDATERNAEADALLDRANGVETGVTLRQAMRAIGASAAGTLSGAQTGQVNIWGVGSSTTRITAATDQSGNRLSVTLNV